MEKKIQPEGRFHFNLKELWDFRELFYFFAWRDIKVKYKQTLLGFLWAVLQPTLVMLIFVFFFARILKVPTDGLPAPIFYFSGLLLWNFFSSGLSSSANSMVENAEMIKKIYFPRLIIPCASILVAFFDFLMALLVFFGLILFYYFYDVHFSIDLLKAISYTSFALLLTIITSLGAGLLLAALNVKYRDFRYIIPFLIQLLMFLSPVIYPLTMFDAYPLVQKILSLNPLSGALSMIRAGFGNTPIDWTNIGISSLGALLLFFIGIFVFRKMEAYFADLA